MDVKEYQERSKSFSKEVEQEQVFDYKPRQKADNDYLAGTIDNSYEIGSREHRLYAEQIKVNEERNNGNR